MGLFDKLFKTKDDGTIALAAHVKGKAVPLSEVSDPTFGEEIMGKGMAIYPEEGKVYAPCDGTIDLMFDTGHAVNIKSKDGVEVLIHVGLETISLKGEGFKTFKKNEDTVKKGDLLIEFDRALLLEKGFDIITPMVICNTDDYAEVKGITGKDVVPGDTVIEIRTK